jgi:hypothetical protein
MHYDTTRDHHGLKFDPFKALVAPRPIGWIGTRGADGTPNLAPYSFFNAVSDKPPMVMFSSAGFKDSLRNADMLLIDDVQFVGGKAGTQEELLSTLTALIEDGKRIVLSADRPPMALTEVEPRLRSHLASGLTCPVEQADRALKLAVARNRIEALARLGSCASCALYAHVVGPLRSEALRVTRGPGCVAAGQGQRTAAARWLLRCNLGANRWRFTAIPTVALRQSQGD